MKRFSLLVVFLLTAMIGVAKTITVKNIEELKQANAAAVPGDVIVLQNGNWQNVHIVLTCSGTETQPITFKAQNTGSVMVSGNSSIAIGGNYITVEGLYFTGGYAGDRSIISFRSGKAAVANHCRVTDVVIDNFNNPKRLDENYWIEFYGKHNRLDHCSFANKKNMGVMLAVILDDDRSRENFHSIDHNYFGKRPPLASNTGEMIRVGVSQHCEFNSNTQITDNFFEHCDGETEIISLKSGSNVVRNNLFKECQGAVVLRHGNYNTVENNIFLGNNKAGTGGVRVINRGQWVVNNLFYQCTGKGFRSPLAVMNGVPNSPANRYVAVSDAVIANNSFIECAPVSFGEGSDTERSEPPHNVVVLNNLFYSKKAGPVYYKYDDMSRIYFTGNTISMEYKQDGLSGFSESAFSIKNESGVEIPVPQVSGENPVSDSLKQLASNRLGKPLSDDPGFSNRQMLKEILQNAYNNCGAKWYAGLQTAARREVRTVDCATAKEIFNQLRTPTEAKLIVNLTGKTYQFSQPVHITSDVTFTSPANNEIAFISAAANPFLIQLVAGHSLTLQNCSINLQQMLAPVFVTTDTSGSSNHSQAFLDHVTLRNGKTTLFNAAKTSVLDSLVVTNCKFEKNSGMVFDFSHENDSKGYYNVERLRIENNTFSKNTGQLLSMLRSGNDESTMGPDLLFANNSVEKCNAKNQPLIYLYGTQLSDIYGNSFTKSNGGGTLIKYDDAVRAEHHISNNTIQKSGNVVKDKFVED